MTTSISMVLEQIILAKWQTFMSTANKRMDSKRAMKLRWQYSHGSKLFSITEVGSISMDFVHKVNSANSTTSYIAIDCVLVQATHHLLIGIRQEGQLLLLLYKVSLDELNYS